MTKRIAIVSVVAASAALAGIATAATSGQAAPAAKKNIVQTAAATGQFDTLVALAKKAGLAGALSTKTLTVFAPTDAAFAKVPKSTLDALAKDRKALRAVLLYHAVAGKVPAAKVVSLTSAKTLEGSKVRFAVRSGNVYVNSSRVTAPDVRASNGIIHVVNKVLLPPSN